MSRKNVAVTIVLSQSLLALGAAAADSPSSLETVLPPSMSAIAILIAPENLSSSVARGNRLPSQYTLAL